MDQLNHALNAILEIAFGIGWRAWIVYMLYRTEGESGLVKALALMIFSVIMCGEIWGYSLPTGGDKLISIVNWYVGCSFFVFGFPGWGWCLALFGIGYSAEREGGVLNRILHGDKNNR